MKTITATIYSDTTHWIPQTVKGYQATAWGSPMLVTNKVTGYWQVYDPASGMPVLRADTRADALVRLAETEKDITQEIYTQAVARAKFLQGKIRESEENIAFQLQKERNEVSHKQKETNND